MDSVEDRYLPYEDIDAEIESIEAIYDSEHDILMAKKEIAFGHLDQAAETLRSILAKESSNPEAHHLLGLIHMEQNQIAPAIQSFQQAVRWDLATAEYRMSLGQAYFRAGWLAQARSELIKAMTLDATCKAAPIVSGILVLEKHFPAEQADAWVKTLQDANDAFNARDNNRAKDLYQTLLDQGPEEPILEERLMNVTRQLEHPGQLCPKAWENARLRPDGTVEVCCLARFRVGDARKSALEDIWNNPEIQKFRESILDGSYRYCSHHVCNPLRLGQFPTEPDVKMPSLRESARTGSPTVEQPDIWMTMVYDQTCNLSCPSCRTEKIVLRGDQFTEAQKVHDLIKSKCLSALSRITVCGQGDPFASRLYRDLLYSLDAKDYPNLKVHLLTNGLLLNQKSWDKMAKIRDRVDWVSISIDAATPETYRKLRRGGQMEHLLPNLEFVSRLRAEGPVKRLQFNFVVQSGNYREMPQFVELGMKFGADVVHFQRMRGSIESSKYEVFVPEHPDFGAFVDILNHPLMEEPCTEIRWADECLTAAGLPPRFNIGPQAKALTDDDEDDIAAFV